MDDWNTLVRRMRATNSLLADEIDTAYRQRNGEIAAEQLAKATLNRSLRTIAEYEITDTANPDAFNMREIARASLQTS